ncbi:hypothetical protein QVD17_37294 [Tagetes erecta]|uniref:Uncharacterized protein n=1 Tax=Tagetes erecta TaxID=13708 RepID=A0AAD8K090_TARER|nr:hypothetical protein QVD17_37294 [Tagetes erecta]
MQSTKIFPGELTPHFLAYGLDLGHKKKNEMKVPNLLSHHPWLIVPFLAQTSNPSLYSPATPHRRHKPLSKLHRSKPYQMRTQSTSSQL